MHLNLRAVQSENTGGNKEHYKSDVDIQHFTFSRSVDYLTSATLAY